MRVFFVVMVIFSRYSNLNYIVNSDVTTKRNSFKFSFISGNLGTSFLDLL